MIESIKIMPEIDVCDRKVSYTRQGKGDPLLMLHGWPMTKEMFSLVIPPLAENCEVITLDFPGFGKSQELAEKHTYGSLVLTVIRFMDKLEIPQATVSGVSMGAAVGLVLASEHPDRVKKLVLNSPPVHHREELTDFQRKLYEFAKKRPIIIPILYKLMKTAPDLFCQLLWGETLDSDNPAKKLMIRHTINTGMRPAYEMLLEFTETDLRPSLSRVVAPTIVFVGTLDHQFLRPAKIIADGVQNGRIKYVEGANHWLAVKNPPLFTRQILDALRLPE
ncbi:alpha/beta hydrolase [Candidatus Gottesmanbacteria bacterium]|nr:alpha/beta hydrolase [Candidatus Gottesmanbacteria bacterium]